MREKLSLDQDWRFHLGDLEVSHGLDHGAIYNAAKAGNCPGPAQGDYDIRDWEVVSLPHDWSAGQPFSEENAADWGYKPKGKGWYQKSFLLPESAKGKTLFIEFEGIATHAVIYFNGSLVARNFNGYVPFMAEITDMALFGTVPNVLAVFVDATAWEGWWYEGAGIYRHTWLHILNPVRIQEDGVFVHPVEQADGSWRVETEIECCNETEQETEISLCAELHLQDGGKGEGGFSVKACLPEGMHKISHSFTVEKPLLWDIDSPVLYELTVTALLGETVVDQVKTVCGFRTIGMDAEKGFFLNHRPVKLFGTCNHQDFGGLGVAVPDNLWEYKIEKLKEMGSNAYRCAHGMPSDALILACDRLGMLVMDENRNFNTSSDGMKQLETLLRRHRNHPSVVMYSIFNEEPLQGTSQGMRMAKRMKHLIHKMVPGSIVTGAMHGGIQTKENAALELDVCGVNYQIGIYDVFHREHPEIPMVATETTSTFGVRSCYETRKEKNEIASYDEDASDWGNTVRDTWKAVMERDFVSGAFMWTGFDYLGEPSPHVWPSVSSFFGVIDHCGFPKDGYYLCKAIFSKEPVCHVLPHWNHAGKEGEMIRVMSHTNCEEAELFVNGKSAGKRKIDLFEQTIWEVPYEPGTIRLVGYQKGKIMASSERKTTGGAVSLRLCPWRECVAENGRDAVPVAVIAVDAEGEEVPDAEELLQIGVEGGTLLGACNGNPNCHEDFFSSQRSLFHGRCLAVIRPEPFAGAVTLSANSVSGALSGSVTIPVIPGSQVPVVPSVTEHYLMQWKLTANVFEEKPDVLQKVEEFDMNSWEDIRVDQESGAPKKLENVQGMYAIYRIRTTVALQMNGHRAALYFYSVWGDCEFYINGVKRGECHHLWPEEYSIPLEEGEAGEAEIRILVQSNNTGAGLCSLVVIR